MEPFILFQKDHLGCQNAFHKLFLDKPQTLCSILLKQSSSLAVSVINTNCSKSFGERREHVCAVYATGMSLKSDLIH